MTKVLLSLHVLAAIVAIGPVTVAAGMFPAAIRRGDLAQMRMLNRICRVYAVLGLTVPVFGLATAASLGVLTDAWLLVSIALTVVAAVVLAYRILPAQSEAVTAQAEALTAQAGLAPGESEALTAQAGMAPGLSEALTAQAGATPPQVLAGRLGMVSGIFNLLWATVVVLMIVRPGSTTGA
ncbi:MAG: hypothetical protein SYR96_16900 [Actinomycetota bacterium]|nr:hypothetical protein [Actinomycetota bacterium]